MSDKVQDAVNETVAVIARSFNAAAGDGSGHVDLAPAFTALIAVVRADEREQAVKRVLDAHDRCYIGGVDDAVDAIRGIGNDS